MSRFLEAYRRHLPHWRLPDAIYQVNWQMGRTRPDLSGSERSLVASALHHFESERYELHAYVVMNDHVHVLTKPLAERRLEDLIHSWKSFTANRMQRVFGRAGPIWQDEYYDRIVRNSTDDWKWVDYILQNPIKRWPGTIQYPWYGLGKLVQNRSIWFVVS